MPPSRDPEKVAAEHVTIDKFGSTAGSESDTHDEIAIAAGPHDPSALADALTRAGQLQDTEVYTDTVKGRLGEYNPGPSMATESGCYRVVFGDDPDAVRSHLLDVVRLDNARKNVVLTGWLACCDDVASLSSWLDELLAAGATVTALQSDVVLTPGESIASTDVTTLLGELASASLTTRDARPPELLRRDWSGRVPVGCEVVAGDLVPAGDYDDVRETLLDVISGELSRRQAAKRIECSPRTVTRIIEDPERRELYRLPASGGE